MTYLLKDKYFPNNFNDFLFHKNRPNFYKNISYDNFMPNVVIYGPKGSANDTIVDLLM